MPYLIDNHGNVDLMISETDDLKEGFTLRFQVDTTGNSIDTGTALHYLELVISGYYGPFMQPGYRNNQAVNMSIALNVLGYEPRAWLEEYLPDIRDHEVWAICSEDIIAFDDHLDRMEPYLEHWSEDPWQYTLD